MPRRQPYRDRSRWEVEKERHHLQEDEPSPLPDAPMQQPSELIPAIMKKFGLETVFWEEQLLREWPAIAGAQVAKNSRPGQIERGLLCIYVRHPTWLSELSRYGHKQLLANLQARFGADKIKKIRFQLDPDIGRK
jgi:predicted nucleic acid-binding Zn ribbon protein